ncbi:MAG: 50S ribosomal protein L32 [Bdellovibrionales bacterium]
MPTPKKKTSRSVRNMRRSHDGLTAKTVMTCPNCSSLKLPHNVCPSCGYYDGREIIPTAQA